MVSEIARNPQISIIVIEYNSLDDVTCFLESINAACKGFDYEIIISSNSGYPREKQISISESYKGAEWIFNPENGGFAYGMNRGLEKSKGHYLVIANPDMVILEGFSKMVAFMDIHPEIGAIGPQALDSEGTIQDTFRAYLSLPVYLKRQIRRIISGESVIYDRPLEINRIQTADWLVGAFLMVRREVYNLTKGLDERYFMYVEDLDWCTRVRQSGFEVVYFPLMKILYKGSRKARREKKLAGIFLKSITRYWKKFGFFNGYPKRNELIFE